MQHSLSALIFPAYRRRVLGLLMLQPDTALHGREIARRTGLPAGTLNRELARLADVGLLKREKRGNQTLYSADRSCPVFEEVASILRKTSGMADVIAEALTALEGIRVAFIFGSVARGAETSGSDVDVLILGSAALGDVVEALHPVQQQLRRDINPKLFTVREWKAKLKARHPFVKDVLAKPKIFLIGDEHELAESGRNQS